MTDTELAFITREIEAYPFSNRGLLLSVARELKTARERLRRIGEIISINSYPCDKCEAIRCLIHGDPK